MNKKKKAQFRMGQAVRVVARVNYSLLDPTMESKFLPVA